MSIFLNPRPVSSRRQPRDSGHLLLAILLMMALMIIAATYEAPRIVQQLRRDREEEMIHRGTEYARAIKKYYKKMGSYPSSIEQLENTNNIRFLRKRYKDPLTKDGKWTLLHYNDVIATLVTNGVAGNTGSRTCRPGPGCTGRRYCRAELVALRIELWIVRRNQLRWIGNLELWRLQHAAGEPERDLRAAAVSHRTAGHGQFKLWKFLNVKHEYGFRYIGNGKQQPFRKQFYLWHGYSARP